MCITISELYFMPIIGVGAIVEQCWLKISFLWSKVIEFKHWIIWCWSNIKWIYMVFGQAANMTFNSIMSSLKPQMFINSQHRERNAINNVWWLNSKNIFIQKWYNWTQNLFCLLDYVSNLYDWSYQILKKTLIINLVLSNTRVVFRSLWTSVGIWLFSSSGQTEGEVLGWIFPWTFMVSKFEGHCSWQINVWFITSRLVFEIDFLHCSLYRFCLLEDDKLIFIHFSYSFVLLASIICFASENIIHCWRY